MVHEFKILHVDDEPETVDWIPEALRCSLLNRPGWTAERPVDSAELGSNSGTTEHRFGVLAGDERITVRYILAADFAAFRGLFEETVPDVVLLDIMDGAGNPEGLQLQRTCEELSKDLEPPPVVALVTAFVGTVMQSAEGPKVIAKPPDAFEVCQFLEHRLDDVMRRARR